MAVIVSSDVVDGSDGAGAPRDDRWRPPLPSHPEPSGERGAVLDGIHDLARRIIGYGRGVARPVSALRAAASTVGRGLLRILALPAGILVGLLAGLLAALAVWAAPLPLRRRALLFPFAPVLGLAIGAALGANLAFTGKVMNLPLLARVIHGVCPIVTFPKGLTHHLHGLTLVSRHRDVRTVLENGEVFNVDVYNDRMRATSGAFFLGMNPGPIYRDEQGFGARALGRDLSAVKRRARQLSQALVDAAAQRASRSLDVVSELAHVVVIDNLESAFGVPDTGDQRLRGWLQTIGFYIFNFWMGGPYRAAAIQAGGELSEHLRRVVRERAATTPGVPTAGATMTSAANPDIPDAGAVGATPSPIPSPSKAEDALDRMLAGRRSTSPPGPLPEVDELFMARTLGGLVSGATVPTIGLFAGVIDVLLKQPAAALQPLRQAAGSGDDETIWRFTREAARFCPFPPTLYRQAATSYAFCTGERRGRLIERGSWVVAAPVLANFDARIFAHPARFDPGRPTDAEHEPLLFGWAQHRCLGEQMGKTLLIEMVKALFSQDIRRAAGPQGQVAKGAPGQIPDGDFAQRLIVVFA
jgi:cytochrome P450